MRATVSKLRLAVSASAFTLAMGAFPGQANAATCNWLTAAGNWVTTGNWSCGAVPTSADDVVITSAGAVVSVSGTTASAGTINLGLGNALNVAGGSTLYIYNGALTNNGTLTVSNNSDFRSGAGTVNVTGNGAIVLDSSIANARLFGGGWIFGSGQTVRGAGQIGINQTIVTNNGLMSANVSGGVLSLDVSGGNGGVGPGNGVGTNGNAGLYNTGTMQATGGGALNFEGGLYENSATGVIQALNGSVVNLNGDSRIVNGTLTSIGTGAIQAFGTSQYLTNVTLSAGSNLKVQNDNLYLSNSLVNNGTITLGGVAGYSQLINEGGTLTLSGTGTIVLDSSVAGSAPRIYGGNIVFGSNQSLTGSGQLGINQTVVTNNGLFSANGGSNLSIDVSGGNGGVGPNNGVGTSLNSGLLNNSIMEATGGSTISFEGGLYENAAGGVIRATNNSFINLNGDSRILNGTLTSDATSAIMAQGTSQYLTNVTLSAGSRLNVRNDNLYLNTTLTNNGTITLGGVAGYSQLINESGTLAINGGGTIILDNSVSGSAPRIYGGNITFGAGQTVQGAGQLGINQTTFTINNVFSANSGSTLDFDVSGGNGGVGPGNGVGTGGNAGLYNTSTIQATGGSTINLGGGLYENSAGGVIQALTGSIVNLGADSRVLNGTLTSVGAGFIQAAGTSQYLTGVTLSAGSNLKVQNDNLYLNTSFTNNGTVTLGGVAGYSQLINEGGTLTLSGSGTIVLDNSVAGSAPRIYGGSIVFGSNQSLTGSGALGINQTIVTNNGLFSANSGSNLSIDVSGGNGGVGVNNGVGTNGNAGLLNNSIMQATGGSTLSFEGGLYENAVGGIIRATNNSFINLNSDSRIVGGTLTSDATSAIVAAGTGQYLTNVTLSAGSNLRVQNDNLYLNTALTNNGTITLGGVAGISALRNETGVLAINGAGTIVLDNGVSGASPLIYGGNVTFGAGQTVRGAGQIGINQTIVTNNGVISGDAGTGISIDVSGGNGGVGPGNGVGTNANAGMFNTGTIRAANGSVLALEGGLYENNAAGTFGAIGAGSQFVMNGDANLASLQAGGVLSLGNYVSSTAGAASVLNLRGAGANSIATIGTGAAGTDTVVTLSGANSVFNVTNFNSGVNTTLDSTLTTVAASGRLNILDGRNFNIVAGPGSLTNNGIVQLGGGALTSTSSNGFNTGLMTGFGTIGFNIANSGTVEALGGVLNTQAITGAAGAIRSNAGATLGLGGASTAGFLTNNGSLALGANNVTVTNDYTNAGFGSGNAFNAHANVTGGGLIFATGATMDLSGPALSGGTLNVGNVRTGGSSSTTLTITNNGAATTLRGAVQNSAAPSVALSTPDFVLTPGGGSTTVTISYTGLTAGSLAGQSLNVVNNFDNVADATIGLAGNIYQVAQAGAQPASMGLGARRVGDAAGGATITIANVAPVTPGYNEALRADASVNNGFLLNGAATASVNNLAAGSTAPITLSRGTGTAGAFNGVVTIANTSLAVTGSGLADLALGNQTIAVSNNVYAAAVANVTGANVNFGAVRAGAASPTGSVGVSNGASGALTDSLVTTIGATPAGVTAGAAPGPLAAGQSGNVNFSLDTSQAGTVSGSTQLNFISHNPEMSDLALGSQAVNFTGTVTDLSVASIFKNAGAGTFAGGGTSYTYDLGTLAANSGSFTTDFGVANLVALSSFSESLGGSFSDVAAQGYTFNGNIFSGLQGGASNTGNFLTFDTTGLSNGTYGKTFTFNGYSAYPGLNNLNLAPITVTITAQINGGGGGNPGGVPEPATWAMMILGFGMIGGAMRRTSKRDAEVAA
ncbi:MAG: choice-of-anchor D domain-containing protein [Proteobacteria bacterium]|nr:choice-of-anchor D domain-containing protein [Pseudomonadota bacterium]